MFLENKETIRDLITIVLFFFPDRDLDIANAINDQLLDEGPLQELMETLCSGVCCFLGVGLGPALELCIAINPR